MKTLRNYEVNGALLQADTGPEAQVGDQVRMYLDTTAQPGFPEYVVGTIQHPIQRVNCGSATNYSIEYNEADLLGEAAQLIPDHVIDAVVVTAFEVLDAALQAEIAARIADVNAEEAARIAADTSEEAARISADTAEATARATADAAEQAARIAADALLVPKTTTVNGHALSSDITVTSDDVPGVENVDNTSDVDKPVSTATQTALDSKASSAIQKSSETLTSAVLFHDDMTGAQETLAYSGTHASTPGPGGLTFTGSTTTSLVRFERNRLFLSPVPQGAANTASVVAPSQTIAEGLTLMVQLIPGWQPGGIGQCMVGFSDSNSSLRLRRGGIKLVPESPYTGNDCTVRISALTSNTDDNDYYAGAGSIKAGEKLALAIRYGVGGAVEYYMQGGQSASLGAVVGSDTWHRVGETTTALSGTVYPYIITQFNGTTEVHDIKVLSGWSPSSRVKSFDYDRTKIGIHIPSFGTDPVSGRTILAWNNSTSHVGAGMSDIRASVLLSDGSWTAPTTILAAPSAPAGRSINAFHVVNGQLYMGYWNSAAATDGGTCYWRTVTINATTGAITLGTETLVGIDGSTNLSFTPIIRANSGRLFFLMHRPDLKSYFSYSDDNGATWSTAALVSSTANLVEPTGLVESDGGIGVYFRSYNLAIKDSYYCRCAAPDAATPTFSTAVPVVSIPQPQQSGYSQGSRLQAYKTTSGRKYVVGNDCSDFRRKITVWEVGDNASIQGKTFLADWNTPQGGLVDAILQYPAMIEVGDDLWFAWSKQVSGGGNLSTRIELVGKRWPSTPVALESGGSGTRQGIIEPPPRRITNNAHLNFATSLVPDLAKSNLYTWSLTASTATVGAPLNPLPWDTLTIVVTQGGSGSYTLAWDSVFQFNGITTTLQTAVNASNVFVFRYNGYTSKWVLQSFS